MSKQDDDIPTPSTSSSNSTSDESEERPISPVTFRNNEDTMENQSSLAKETSNDADEQGQTTTAAKRTTFVSSSSSEDEEEEAERDYIAVEKTDLDPNVRTSIANVVSLLARSLIRAIDCLM